MTSHQEAYGGIYSNNKGYLMPTGIVQNIFRDHYDGYKEHNFVSSREHKAASNIITCRTSQQGYHIDECPTDTIRLSYTIRASIVAAHNAV